jgi:hypothetical protein
LLQIDQYLKIDVAFPLLAWQVYYEPGHIKQI